jgi:UDP-2,3-diacylglucosamine pyrophosphatase LpxH
MNDALIISDIHLGSDVCEAKKVIEFLESIIDGTLQTRRLILNGDVFDNYDFRRLKKRHWKVLSLLRKLSDRIEVVWICGNHDGPAELVSHLIGVEVVDEYVCLTGGKELLVLHGHQFDKFLDQYPIVSKIADLFYRLLQKIDPSCVIPWLAKWSSKKFLRCIPLVESGALKKMVDEEFDMVSCGHTHNPVATEQYFNSGCWTESPCSYLIVKNGQVRLERW